MVVPRLSRLSLVSLDAYPLFWRECRLRTPTRWLGLLWAAYVVGAILFTALAVVRPPSRGLGVRAWTGPFNGFQSAVGLVLLSIVVSRGAGRGAVAGQSRAAPGHTAVD